VELLQGSRSSCSAKFDFDDINTSDPEYGLIKFDVFDNFIRYRYVWIAQVHSVHTGLAMEWIKKISLLNFRLIKF
jgi:hypothetical protein